MSDLELNKSPFSIVIPTCKRLTSLARALDSLPEGAQVYIVDDSGEDSDDCIDALPQIQSLDVTVIKNDVSRGASYSRNLGASLVSREWICFLDDDDRLTDEYFRSLLKLTDSSPHVAAWIPDTVGGLRHEYGCVPANDVMKRNRVGGCSGFFVRKSLFDRIGGFDVDLRSMQDWDLWIRLLECDALYYSGQSGVIYDTSSRDKITHDLFKKYVGLRRLIFKHHGFWSHKTRKHHILRLWALRFLLSPKAIRTRRSFLRASRYPLLFIYFLKWSRYRT
ncbi:glycosyltransferase family 2 protein [Opitutales bacterium]|nr:glycosyltransferase family 2 protein [Opitutales bacterium]